MPHEDRIALINELLGRRREYYAHFGSREAGPNIAFTDVDYALTCFLLPRLGINRLAADTATVASLFCTSAPLDRLPRLTVFLAGDAAPAEGPDAIKAHSTLYLFSPATCPPQHWFERAAAEGSLSLCYGLSDCYDASAVDLPRVMLPTPADVALPLFGLAPGLWRAASLLLVPAALRATVEPLRNDFIRLFHGADLDPMRLAEDNAALRSRVAKLTEPGTHEADRARLTEMVAALEADVARLRQIVKRQEETIALAQQTTPARGPAIKQIQLATR